MVEAIVLDFPTKLLLKLKTDQIREALQPSPAQSMSVTGQPQHGA